MNENLKKYIEVFDKKLTEAKNKLDFLDNKLDTAKYGSYGHVTNMISKNVAQANVSVISEVIQVLSGITNNRSLHSLLDNIEKLVEEYSNIAESNLDALKKEEPFSMAVINMEITIRSNNSTISLYKELQKMIEEAISNMNDIPGNEPDLHGPDPDFYEHGPIDNELTETPKQKTNKKEKE